MARDDLSSSDAAIRDRILSACSALGSSLSAEDHNPAKGPKVLYHYTRAAGLMGILMESQIHVSRAACLNDLQELTYGENLAREVLMERTAEVKAERGDSRLVQRLHEVASGPKPEPGRAGHIRLEPFVASFSAKPDLIGMWAYFARDGGYCLGFTRSRLTDVVGTDPSFSLSPVVYRLKEQRRILRKAIKEFERLVTEQLTSLSPMHQIAGIDSAAVMLRIVFHTLAVRMKAPSFAPEEEWRLITTAMEGSGTSDEFGEKDAENTHFRSVGNRIVPYFRATYGLGKAPVVSIKSGPTVDAQIARDSVLRMLKSKKYPWRKLTIDSSQVWLRD